MKLERCKAKLKLRWYQEKALDEFFSALDNLFLQISTGGGKGIICVGFCDRAIKEGKRVLVVVRRIHLVKDLSGRLIKFGIEHGVLQGNNRKNLRAQVLVASIDTLIHYDLKKLKAFDYLFIDEAHDAVSPGYKDVIKFFKGARIFAQSATPYPTRDDLTHLADRIIRPVAYMDLVSEGFLVKSKAFAPIKPDLSDVRQENGDYKKSDLYSVYTSSAILNDIAPKVKAHANGLRSLLFAPSKDLAQRICDTLNEAGIPAAYADDQTPIEERVKLIEALERREILVICNVLIFGTGVDIPCLEAVICCRPTRTLSLWVQMAGRGARTYPEKQNYILLDMAGNIERHGLPEFAPDGWLKCTGSKAGDSEHNPGTKECPECKHIFLVGARPYKCPECNWIEILEPDSKPEKPEIEVLGQEVELEAVNENLEIIREIRSLATELDERHKLPGALYFAVKRSLGHEIASRWCPPDEKENFFNIYSTLRNPISNTDFLRGIENAS